MPRKSSFLGACAFYLSFFAVINCGQGRDVYVATNGSDKAVGSLAEPWRTITHAYARAEPGIIIHVLPGVYDDYTKGWGLRLSKKGKANRPIVLRSSVQGGAIVEGHNRDDRNQGFYIEGDYHVIDGFQIRNCPKGGIKVYGDANRILNNEIHHNGNRPSPSNYGQDGIYSEKGTRDNVYIGNSIHDNGRTGSNYDHGLYLCGKNEFVIRNLLYRNATCGLQIAGYTTVGNMKVYNNVVAWNGTTGIILWKRLDGIEIKNNILYKNGRYGLGSWEARGKGVVVDHNLFFGNGAGDYTFTAGKSDYTYTLGKVIRDDPCFVNGAREGFDAHLRPRSPAIGAGIRVRDVFPRIEEDASSPTNPRCDLGAFVCEGVTSATASRDSKP